jgi:glycosyltransferase involved in cell wall biosynthesis
MDEPTFSVIVAAYNAADTIGDAITSALEQSPPPLELIVGDDESTDDLAGALAPFGEAVRVVRIRHGGEGAAKNAAASTAVGDFIAFLDADDSFLPGRLAALGALARARPDADILTTDAYLVYRDRRLGRCYGPGHAFADVDQRTAILRTNFILGLSAVRRTRFLEVGGFDLGVAYTVDWELWMRLILSGSRAAFIDEPLAEYRLHASSMSARRADMSRGRLDSLARVERRGGLSVEELRVLEETRRAEEARLLREELRSALAAGSARDARRAALRVLRAPRQSVRTRLKALASSLAPAPAARRIRSENEQTFVTVGDRRLPR